MLFVYRAVKSFTVLCYRCMAITSVKSSTYFRKCSLLLPSVDGHASWASSFVPLQRINFPPMARLTKSCSKKKLYLRATLLFCSSWVGTLYSKKSCQSWRVDKFNRRAIAKKGLTCLPTKAGSPMLCVEIKKGNSYLIPRSPNRRRILESLNLMHLILSLCLQSTFASVELSFYLFLSHLSSIFSENTNN